MLWGERIGLLPVDDDVFTVYFGDYPLGMFYGRKLRVTPLPRTGPHNASACGTGAAAPVPQTTTPANKEKVSGMRPV